MTTDAHSAVTQFRAAMMSAGITTDAAIVADGRLHRIHVKGDRRGKRNGWYVLHSDGDVPAGAFGSWRTGAEGKWSAATNGELGPTERREHVAAIEAERRRRAAEEAGRQQRGIARAERLWRSAAPANPRHPYLVAKGVQSHGVRQLDDELLIPVRSADGTFCGLQRIDRAGAKKFTSGTRKRGAYFPIGRLEQILIVCEGFATGASIFEATRHAVAVAFDAGNLLPVVEVLDAKHPSATLLVAADDDRFTDGNPGLTKARAAAGGRARLVVPTFSGSEPGTDFNDVAALRGLDAVRAAFGAVLERASDEHSKPNEGWRAFPVSRRTSAWWASHSETR